MLSKQDRLKYRCGARKRLGRGLCGSWPLKGKKRCRLHGGNNPGGPTHIIGPKWRLVVTTKQKLYKSLGIPWYGGRPRKAARIGGAIAMAKEILQQEIGKLEAKNPLLPEIMQKPVGELSAPEALARASLSGLQQLVRIIEQPLDLRAEPDDIVMPHELKMQRLIGDMAFGANRLFARVAEGELRGRQADALGKLLAEIATARK